MDGKNNDNDIDIDVDIFDDKTDARSVKNSVSKRSSLFKTISPSPRLLTPVKSNEKRDKYQRSGPTPDSLKKTSRGHKRHKRYKSDSDSSENKFKNNNNNNNINKSFENENENKMSKNKCWCSQYDTKHILTYKLKVVVPSFKQIKDAEDEKRQNM